MRYGLFSDVHCNSEALAVCLADLAEAKVDCYAFLGDAVGYGGDPEVVCTTIRERAAYAVLGNHDAAVVGRMSYDYYYDAAKQSLQWCAKQLSPANLEWLTHLPYTQRSEDGEVGFCHAAPDDPALFDYVIDAERATDVRDACYEHLASVTFIGHSHLPVAFRMGHDKVEAVVEPEFVCERDAKYLITVGSVGQPRDRDPRACWGIFDSETRKFTYRRASYDIQAAANKIRQAGLADIFADRLSIGV